MLKPAGAAEGDEERFREERRALIGMRVRVVAQHQVARIARRAREDGELHLDEIRREAKALPDDWGERRPERDPVPFVEPAPRRLPVLKQCSAEPRKRLPAERLNEQKKHLRERDPEEARDVALLAKLTPERRTLFLQEFPEPVRPKTWGECRRAGVYTIPGRLPEVQHEDGARRFWGDGACPWLGCEHHLGLNVNDETGTLQRVEGYEDGRGHCALEVAHDGAKTLEEVGALVAVTRERIRQITDIATGNWKAAYERDRGRDVN